MERAQELLAQVYFGNTLAQYLSFFAVVAGSLILGRVVYFIFRHHLRRLAGKTASSVDDELLTVCDGPIVVAIAAAGIFVGRNFLDRSEGADRTLTNIVLVMLALAVTWLLLRLVDVLINNYLEPLVAQTESKLDDQILPIVRKSSKTVIALLAAIVVLSNLGYDILSVLAGLGIGGLAVALAAQDALKNIIGGITIFWDKPFQLEDWVSVGSTEGEIREIGLRSTRLETVGGTTIIIPNSNIVDSPIENYAGREARRRVIVLGLVYSTTSEQLEEAIELARRTIADNDGTRPEDTLVRFVNFGPYSLDLEIVYWITGMDDWRMIVHRVNLALKRNFDAAGLEMAFPTETHHVVQQPNS